jgi:hypothetical protein
MEAADKRRNEDILQKIYETLNEFSSPSHKPSPPLSNPSPSPVENPSTYLSTSGSHVQGNTTTASTSLRSHQPNFDRYGNRQYSLRRKVKRPDGTLAEESFKNARAAEKERQHRQSRNIYPEPPASAYGQRTVDQIVSATEKPKQKATQKTNRAKRRPEHNLFSSEDSMAPYIPPHLRPEFLKLIKNPPQAKCDQSSVVNNPAVLSDLEDGRNKDSIPPVPGPDGSKPAP